MTQIPIRALTLYKQGIAHFRRRGPVTGTTTSLVVPRESLNDVLKSLDLVLHAGGPIQSVDYETPADKEGQLAGLPVHLGERAGLADLLASLRGSPVEVTLDGGATAVGRVVGVEASLGTSQAPAVVLQREAEVQVIPLDALRQLAVRDQRAADDIRFFLDISRTEQTRTTLTIRLGDGVHDLELSYSAPSPTWRVSYRLSGVEAGRARLVGWGLFDNTLDEDLEAVELTLVSGRPVSFTYDLARTRVPPRPEVDDDPSALEQVAGDRATANAIATLSHEIRTPLTVIRGTSEMLARGMTGTLSDDQRQLVLSVRDNAVRITNHLNSLFDLVRIRDEQNPALPGFLQQSGPLGDLKVSASYFLPMQGGNAEEQFLTYQVPTPISVRRGQAALVPLLDTEVAYEELCVYNGAKMSNHPLRVWRLRNTSGVALEQGPITVSERGRYRGEGIVRFTGVGDELQIPFALEFGILVSEEFDYLPRALADVVLNADERRAEVSWYHGTQTRYRLASNVGADIGVLVERRDSPRGEYYESPEPAERQEGHSRWLVPVPARGMAELVVREREVRTSYENVTNWTATMVDELRSAGAFSEATHALLLRLVALGAEDAATAGRRTALEQEQGQIVALQEQLRKNLGALGTSEREGALRDRLLDDLEASEERRRAISAERRELDQQVGSRERQREAILDELYASS
jgi:signal transduction histidine kinase